MTKPNDGLEGIENLIANSHRGECSHGAVYLNPLELRQSIKDYASKAVKKAEIEAAKAYGGCTNCYGKGYSTGGQWHTAKGKKFGKPVHLKYCACDRGKQLSKLFEKAKIEARMQETNLWYFEWGMSDDQIGDGSWEEFHAHRLAELNKQKGEM